MRWDVLSGHSDVFLSGLLVTVRASVLTLALSMGLAIIVASLRIGRMRVLRGLSRAYVEFLQNTPHIVVVFFAYYGLPRMGLTLSAFASGVVGLSIYSSAFMSEALRSGVNAVPRDNWEAGESSGLSTIGVFRHIVLPQAFAHAFPPLTNQWVRAVKNTSILAVIAGGDLLYHATRVASQTFAVFEVYGAIAIVYLSLTIPLSRLSQVVERRVAWRAAQLGIS